MIATLQTALVVLLLVAALFFTLVSTVGVIRLPDVYSRAHTASQMDTLGAGFGLAAVGVSFGWHAETVKVVLLLFFLFVTNPTAAHAISRAAYEEGIEPWTADGEDATDLEGDATGAEDDADGGIDS